MCSHKQGCISQRNKDRTDAWKPPDRKVLPRNLSFFRCPNPCHKAHLCAKNHNRTLQPTKRHHQCMHHVSNSPGHHAWGMVVVVVVTVISHVLSQTRMHQSKKQRQNRQIAKCSREIVLSSSAPTLPIRPTCVPNTTTAHSNHPNDITSACTMSQIVQAIMLGVW